MFGSSTSFLNYPNSLNDLQNEYMKQLNVMQQIKDSQESEYTILDQINKEISSLNNEEQMSLASMQDYQLAKQTYEASFMEFLGNKFAMEFVNSPSGKIAANNLLASIKKAKEKVNLEMKSKQEKINAMLALLDKDPEIRKKYEELITNGGN